MSGWQSPASYQSRPVAVLGGGVLGRRIAACWMSGGWNVRIRDPSQPQREQAEQYVKENIGTYTALTNREPGSISTFDDLKSAVKDAWLVVEAVPEKLQIKVDTFADLEKYTDPDCILASNSSSYKSSEMLGSVGAETRKRILNTHYMMPPETMVVELMTDGHTSPEIFQFLEARHREAGLHPITALKESTGFVFNRVWAAIKREVLKVIQEGVSTPEVVDAVFMEMYGAKQGPCRMMDNVGLDTVSFIEQHYVSERGLDRVHLDWINEKYVKAGKLGKKTPTKGGLYPPSSPGQRTKLIFLNLGAAEPLNDKLSMQEAISRGSILGLNIDDGDRKATEILSHEAMPDGIDIIDDRIYWTDMGMASENDGTVWSAKFDGSDIKPVIKRGQIHTPKQLVCDKVVKKIYVCDREGCRVMRVNHDGSSLETLMQNPIGDIMQWCVGIAISRKHNKFFWTQKGPSKGAKGRIFSASLDSPKDPANRPDVELVAGNLPEPIDLEFDEESSVLYWTDRGELPLGNTLNKKTIGGQTPAAEQRMGRQILAQGFGEAIGLKLDKEKDCIFVTDLGGHVWKCDPHRPARKEKVYESETGAFAGLTIVKV